MLFVAMQAGRVWRDGQKKKVFVYRFLTTGTIEEKVGCNAGVCHMGTHKLLHESRASFEANSLRA
jgi:hypothetical protein